MDNKQEKSSRERNTFFCGNFKSFERNLEKLKMVDDKIITTHSGVTKKIYTSDGKVLVFKDEQRDGIIKGAFLVRMVKKDVEKYISENPDYIPAQNMFLEYAPVVAFNYTGIQNMINKPLISVDINHCYFRTAYLLGYISEKTYLKGLPYKKAMNASIGALNKYIYKEEYSGGEKTREFCNEDEYLMFKPIYHKILERVSDCMHESFYELGDDMVMWLTDCAFINEDALPKLHNVFEKYGYEYKIVTSEITAYDKATQKIDWWDYKNKELTQKSMKVTNRWIEKLNWK